MLSSVLLDNSRLEATMDRRTFIRLVAGSAACSFVGGAVPAGAEELDDNFIPFSPDIFDITCIYKFNSLLESSRTSSVFLLLKIFTSPPDSFPDNNPHSVRRFLVCFAVPNPPS